MKSRKDIAKSAASKPQAVWMLFFLLTNTFLEAGISQRTLLNRLSDGQRERVMLILALGTQAELYLLDEPVSGSDPALKKEIRRFLMKYLPKDATILMATHLLRDFEQLFDQVIFLTREGLLQKEPEQLREMCGMSAEQYYLEVIGNGK